MQHQSMMAGCFTEYWCTLDGGTMPMKPFIKALDMVPSLGLSAFALDKVKYWHLVCSNSN